MNISIWLLIFSLFQITFLYSQDFKSGLAAYFPFNGNANDESGNDNNGIVNGAILANDRFGATNSSYYFNGSSSIKIDNPTFLDNTDNATICIWFNSTTVDNNYRQLMGSGDNRPFKDPISIQYINGQGFNFTFWDGSKNKYAGYTGGNCTSIKSNQWNFIAVQLINKNNQSTYKVYLNGELACLTTSDMSIGIKYDTPMDTRIGAIETPSSQQWMGYIDDIRIYKRALSDADILALYHEAGAPSLISPANNSTKVPLTPTLVWSNIDGASNYVVQISSIQNFSFLLDSADVNTNQYTIPAGKLNGLATYFWRVKSISSFGSSHWSVVWNFATTQ